MFIRRMREKELESGLPNCNVHNSECFSSILILIRNGSISSPGAPRLRMLQFYIDSNEKTMHSDLRPRERKIEREREREKKSEGATTQAKGHIGRDAPCHP